MSKSRSILFRSLLLLVTGALLLVACVPAAAPGAQPAATKAPTEAPAAVAAGEVSRADTLIFARNTTDLISLDPAVAYEFSGIQAEASVYETLVSFDPGQPGVKPVLAASWEIKADGDMWAVTFKLNPEAKFASGNPVTADDVVFSWSRAIDINKSPAFLLSDTSGIKKENLKAIDAQTFEVKIPNTVSPQVFLSVITFTVAAVVEKAAVEANMGSDMGESWLNDHSAGSGAYVLTSWEREVAVTLDANANYWGGSAPAIQRVIIQNVQEQANRQAMIETGDADLTQELSPEQMAALAGNADVQVVNAANTQLVYIGMNAMKAPLDNADVREAIRYAINYDELQALIGTGATIVQEIIPTGFLGHTGNNPFKQDIAKAKELLAKAGVAEGTEIEALVPSDFPAGPIDFPTLATKIQADLEKVGLKLNLKQLQVSELLKIYRAQEGQMTFILWGPDYPDPDGNVNPFANYAAKSIAWRNGWDNADAAKLAKEAAIAPSDAERTKLYAELNDLVQHQGPYVMLYQPQQALAIRSNIVGFVFDPNDTPAITFASMSKK